MGTPAAGSGRSEGVGTGLIHARCGGSEDAASLGTRQTDPEIENPKPATDNSDVMGGSNDLAQDGT
jgi:hypothetical protein